jgi:divalent metal cation (Fe/Co/Zn/Cd) transporter
MLKKRFYDILTVVYVVLSIGVFLIGIEILAKNLDKAMAGDMVGYITPMVVALIIDIILTFIYWAFIWRLAINLHKANFTNKSDLVMTTLFTRMGVIYYLTNLRKSLKQYYEKYPN